MSKFLALVIVLLFCIVGCSRHAFLGGRDSNVCKTLKEKVILFAVFVDSPHTHPWSEYDLMSTQDSIQRAVNWLESQAAQRGKNIEIEVVVSHNDSVIPIRQEFKYKTLSGTLFKFPNITKGIKLVDTWADDVAQRAGKFLPPDKSKKIATDNKLSDRERLIARLRDIYQTDNVALMYFINHYYENEISVSLHTGNESKTEYAIVSDKKAAVVAHEFLHLFGAWDLYISPFDKSICQRHRKKKVMKQFPNELMAFAYRDLDTLQISPLTEYLIGWRGSLDKKYAQGFIGWRFRVMEY